MIVCEECGCEKVQTLTWVEINSQKVHEAGLSGGESEQDNWCPDCTTNCSITDKTVYDRKQLEDRFEDIIVDELYIIYPEDGDAIVCKTVEMVKDIILFQDEQNMVYSIDEIKDFKLKNPKP